MTQLTDTLPVALLDAERTKFARPVVLDDLKSGDWITVHTGLVQRCPCGCDAAIGHEAYEQFKGLPLAVLGIQLPYVCAAISSGQRVVLDTRACRLMRVEGQYLKAFGVGKLAAGAAAPATEQVVESKEVQSGG
jgi:hypothetical protein